jgi:hypothetical protein
MDERARRVSFLFLFAVALFQMGAHTSQAFVNYPAWQYIGAESFPAYHRVMTSGALRWLLLPRVAELMLAILVLRFPPTPLERWTLALASALALGALVSTIAIQRPIHVQLESLGNTADLLARLELTDWLRQALEWPRTGLYLWMAAVLLRMGKFEQARPIVQAVAKSADRTWSSRAETLLAQIDQAQQFRANNGERTIRAAPSESAAAAAANSVNASDAERPAPVMRRRAQPSDPAPEGASDSVAAKTAAPAESSTAVTPTHSYSMKGTIATVVCSNVPQMQLTLQATGIEMHLHAADIAKIEVRTDTGHATPPTPPWRG